MCLSGHSVQGQLAAIDLVAHELHPALGLSVPKS
jgi:hypothetical protein